MLRVPYSDLESALHKALLQLDFEDSRARLCARLFAETTRDGVYTHGLARFPRFTAMVRNGSVNPKASPTQVSTFAGIAIERWDGNRGPGNLNAHDCMERSIALARQYGLGAVALANTNHWMRGGTYGWQAADAGLFALCFSNTLPNLPAWGTATPTLGNNPFILAVPRPCGNVVLDMAMSQFSYGSLAAFSARHSHLPVPGGYDTAGNLTTDAAAIEASQRALPIGYWKGSGLALTLDLIAAMLSGGLATHQIGHDPLRESGQSQFFLAIDPTLIAPNPAELPAIADAVLAHLRAASATDPNRPVRYPGEQTLALREENLRLGIPVDPETWQSINTTTAGEAGEPT